MGNVTSGEDKIGNLETSNISRKKLHSIFRHLAKESLSNVELISISNSLFGNIKGLNEIILYEDLLEKINLKILLNDNRSDLLYNFLKKISNWPCLSNYEKNDDKIKSFTLYDIIILISIFNGKVFKKIGLNDEYFIHLIFIILISLSDNNNNNNDKEINNNSNIDLIIENNKIKWDLLPIVQSFDQLDNHGINKIQLNKFLNILLPLSIHSINLNSFNLNFTSQINSIITTIFLSDSNLNSKFEEIVTFNKFLLIYNSFCPYLFNPLNKLFEPLLLYNNNNNKDLKIELNYKILNFQLLAQLSTILNIEKLDITINSKPLYQGSKDGYSINSIQSHTLNYRANTLLLISGKTINNLNNNSFFNKFPKFHPVLNSNLKIKEKSKFQIAIYLTEPWKISNTKNFGSNGFKIIQLNPFQIILNSNNNSLMNEYAYFSNIGCGLGFGSKPPIKSKDIKNNNLKFNIGGISLTIDNSLEIGNFRIEDLSNKNSTYILNNNNYNNYNNNNLFNDIWFKVNEIEIYGLGNQQSLKDQKLAMEWEEREAERRRGLGNKDYQEGKALLELAGIIGGSQSGGSM